MGPSWRLAVVPLVLSAAAAFVVGGTGRGRVALRMQEESAAKIAERRKMMKQLCTGIKDQYAKGDVVVIKYGGHAMTDDDLKQAFAEDIATLVNECGLRPVVVHGGGPQIGSMLDRMGIESQFVGGLRVTDEPSMEVVQMVLCGMVNKEVASLISRSGAPALGLCGKDAGLIEARRKPKLIGQPDGSVMEADLGLVGEPVRVNAKLLMSLLDQGIVPVIAPVGMDEGTSAATEGRSLNINADTAAGAVAAALEAKRLLLLTDVAGVLDDKKELIRSVRADEVMELALDGVITGGMIPKLETAMNAVQRGVHEALIVDGRERLCALKMLLPERESGTSVTLT